MGQSAPGWSEGKSRTFLRRWGLRHTKAALVVLSRAQPGALSFGEGTWGNYDFAASSIPH